MSLTFHLNLFTNANYSIIFKMPPVLIFKDTVKITVIGLIHGLLKADTFNPATFFFGVGLRNNVIFTSRSLLT